MSNPFSTPPRVQRIRVAPGAPVANRGNGVRGVGLFNSPPSPVAQSMSPNRIPEEEEDPMPYKTPSKKEPSMEPTAPNSSPRKNRKARKTARKNRKTCRKTGRKNRK